MFVDTKKFYFEAEVIKERKVYKLVAKQDKPYSAVLVVMQEEEGEGINEQIFATVFDFFNWLKSVAN